MAWHIYCAGSKSSLFKHVLPVILHVLLPLYRDSLLLGLAFAKEVVFFFLTS